MELVCPLSGDSVCLFRERLEFNGLPSTHVGIATEVIVVLLVSVRATVVVRVHVGPRQVGA